MAETTQQQDVKVFEFAAGLFGFPNAHRFTVVSVPGGGDVFKQLVSLDQPDLAFTLVYPFAFFPDYAPDIPDEDAAAIEAKSPEEVVVMVIANVPGDFKQTTANLKAPLVFNPHTLKARQVILAEERYGTRERLFKA